MEIVRLYPLTRSHKKHPRADPSAPYGPKSSPEITNIPT